MHPLVLEVLQELAEAGEIRHLWHLGQTTGFDLPDLVQNALQRLHRGFDEFGHRPDTHPRLGVMRPQHLHVFAFDLLQRGGGAANVGEILIGPE